MEKFLQGLSLSPCQIHNTMGDIKVGFQLSTKILLFCMTEAWNTSLEIIPYNGGLVAMLQTGTIIRGVAAS